MSCFPVASEILRDSICPQKGLNSCFLFDVRNCKYEVGISKYMHVFMQIHTWLHLAKGRFSVYISWNSCVGLEVSMRKCFLSSVILLLQSTRPAWPVVPSLLRQRLANCHWSETVHVLIKTKFRKISLQYKLYFRWCVLIYTLGFFKASTA